MKKVLAIAVVFGFCSLSPAMHYTPEQRTEVELWGLRNSEEAQLEDLITNAVKKGKVNFPLPMSHQKTPLHIATRASFDDFVNWLLNNGADVKLVDENGNTALFDAVMHGHDKVVTALINAKIDVNHQNKAGDTVLHLVRRLLRDSKTEAERDKYHNIQSQLILAGARADIANKKGKTPADVIAKQKIAHGPELPEKL